MAAKIYQFPIQINGQYTSAYIDWQYKTFYDEEEDEYIMDQWTQDQNEQKKERVCFAHKLARKILSIFQ